MLTPKLLVVPLLGLFAAACINLPDIEPPQPGVPSPDGGDGGVPMDGGSDGGTQPGPTDGGADQTAPAVIRTLPPHGATRVAVDSAVEVDFSEEMMASTLRVTSVPTVTFTLSSWAPELRRAVFAASAPLAQDTQYTLSVEGKDLAGNTLPSPYLFTFTTTGPAPDTTRPTVTSSSPAQGSRGNPKNVSIKLTFSEPMNKASVEQSLTVSPPGGSFTGTSTWNAASTEVTFTPATAFPHGTIVSWSLEPTSTDLAGNMLDRAYGYSFNIIQWSVFNLSPSPSDTVLVSTQTPPRQIIWPIGDDPDNLPYHGFVSFPLQPLINNGCRMQAEVRSAVLSWPYSDPGISPFSSLGKFLVDPVNYGSNTDNNYLYTTPSIGVPLALNYQDFNVQSGTTHVPVTAMVLERWGNPFVQFRLKFEYTTDNDNGADQLLIDTANLFLNVTCEHP
jgi:hypothetical protein